MYSIWQRTGTFVGFFSSCLFVVLPIIAALNFFIPIKEPEVNLQVENVINKLGVEDYFMNRKVMLTQLAISLDADFSGLFHWNTKQLFLYAVIEYETSGNIRNQVIFWDKIIKSKDRKKISVSGLRSKYPITDIDDDLLGKHAVLKLYWNTVPHVGYLFDSTKGQISVRIPGVGERYQPN